jgi:hypothetical protein
VYAFESHSHEFERVVCPLIILSAAAVEAVDSFLSHFFTFFLSRFVLWLTMSLRVQRLLYFLFFYYNNNNNDNK